MNYEGIGMTQKLLCLPEDVYNKLKAAKQKSESLPELILRLLNENNPQDDSSIESFFGAFEEESDQWGKIESKLYNNRLRTIGDE
jgi:predicted CopG family antitoxin